MNYIKHLTAIFQLFNLDQRLNPTHISLYYALFYYWNWNRFAEIFFIQREEIMQLSKIGSTGTYHRCLNDLHTWNYVEYIPSRNPYKGSQIKMIIFETSIEQDMKEQENSTENDLEVNQTGTEQDQKENEKSIENDRVSIININKHNKHDKPKNKKEVIEFFKTKNLSSRKALKFFYHYESIGWINGNKLEITNWKSLAEGWIVISKERRGEKDELPEDNLKISKSKDYGQPL